MRMIEAAYCDMGMGSQANMCPQKNHGYETNVIKEIVSSCQLGANNGRTSGKK
jgi:hypothetical protein